MTVQTAKKQRLYKFVVYARLLDVFLETYSVVVFCYMVLQFFHLYNNPFNPLVLSYTVMFYFASGISHLGRLGQIPRPADKVSKPGSDFDLTEFREIF